MKTIKTGNITIRENEFDNFIYLYTRFVEKEKHEVVKWKGQEIESGVALILVSNMNRELGYTKKQIELTKKFI